MKRIITFSLLLAAGVALTNCAQKESYAPVQEETIEYVNCEAVVKLPAETKTINDGLSTKWVTEDPSTNQKADQISLAYSYTIDVPFLGSKTYEGETDNPFNHVGNGRFVGKLEREVFAGFAASLTGGKITAKYPAKHDGSIPVSTAQKGYDSMKHLAGANCPLTGSVEFSWDQDWGSMGSADRTYILPEVCLEHITSVIEVAVKNNTAAAVNVNEVDFLVDGAVKATTVVENAGALKVGDTAKVYIVVEPGTYSNMSFKVNDSFVKKINAAEAVFTAGKIKKVNFVIE